MSNAAEREPMPTGDGQVVITGVIKDLLNRDEVGTKKYGTTLKTQNGRDTLMDAYQEALDLCMYLKQTIMDRDASICDGCSCSECDRDYIADIRKSAVHG